MPSGSSGQATINDIARLAGVSKKTVSRVINRSPLVHPETREKVEALIREHNYAPDPMARGLAFRKSFLIGMIYDNPNAQYIVHMQNGALDSLRGSGFELVVHPCDSKNADYVDGVRQFVLQQRLYGVILVPRVSEDQALVDMLREIDCRYARIGAVELDDHTSMITTNDREGAVEVAKYVESLGHRHIGLITGPHRYLSARERGGGFLQTLAQRGIKVPAKYTVEGGYTFESGVACAERLLALTPRPTVIFALNDEMAAGVYKAAYRLGLRIPDQLSVVGFDDSPLASRLWPSLTTVRLPIRDIGLRAAAMLLQEPGSNAAPVAFTPHLVVRESCQPPE
ncbi:LacI family DNA-binding transcriptional regulator [Pseudolysobacter antarcticus]|uniref:LacI family DNA-binding transcriptional regulator n=1 Tax=Pseudolysobacter antarcticus TaxID=2511995 RepID=A0A411HPU5_9GAMM|nr:LacI family DNA-binding transcriptional regulator [Pseudolysobacter antarcticus]QBB72531.1 LacI family DNA-binding transcriptional regulator [Pseudolysobacter antarcticus]